MWYKYSKKIYGKKYKDNENFIDTDMFADFCTFFQIPIINFTNINNDISNQLKTIFNKAYKDIRETVQNQSSQRSSITLNVPDTVPVEVKLLADCALGVN